MRDARFDACRFPDSVNIDKGKEARDQILRILYAPSRYGGWRRLVISNVDLKDAEESSISGRRLHPTTKHASRWEVTPCLDRPCFALH